MPTPKPAATTNFPARNWERYRSFDELVTADPLFTDVPQPGIGAYRAARAPISVDGAYPPARIAPRLGEHTDVVLRDELGLASDDIARLRDTAPGATDSPKRTNP